MEATFLLSSCNASASTSLPCIISYRSHFLEKPKSVVHSNFSLLTKQLAKSQFMGKQLVLQDNYGCFGSIRNNRLRFEPTTASVVKRRKELPFDNVIERDKKLKIVLKIRKILMNQPNRIMLLRELGQHRRELGLKKRRRFISLLRKFPAVFEIVEEGAYSLEFKLTQEAERLYLEELKLRNGLEGVLVVKLRKLLMMSIEKRILVEKIAHLMTDFGLPFDFRNTICRRYPEYFRVVPTELGPALELTDWDPALAVSAAELSEEDNRARELEEKNLIIDRPSKFKRVKLPKGLKLSNGEMKKIQEFRDMSYISPYSDFSEYRPGTKEKEKHACAVVHEILSLTVEKRTLVDHFTHFREEFRFSQQLRGMLIRHPDLFYVSLKGDRDSVFLREAYSDSRLVDVDPLVLIKDKFRALVNVPKSPTKSGVENDEEGTDVLEDESDSDREDGSDIDSYMTDGELDDENDDNNDVDDDDDDNDDDDEVDEWNDEDDDGDTLDDIDGETVKIKMGSSSGKTVIFKSKCKEPIPMFPDGQLRERW